MTPIEPGAYEIVLRFGDGVEEVYLGDQLDRTADGSGAIHIRGRQWLIIGSEASDSPLVNGRLICELVPDGDGSRNGNGNGAG
jgi:hypothetical protein